MAEPALQTDEFDYLNPDYTAIFAQRAKRLLQLRKDPELMKAVKIHYRHNPWDFITDWGMTFDPRKLDAGQTPHMPFLLWPRQKELIQWFHWMWQGKNRGQVEKSRDFGVTWCAVAWACTQWLFVPGFVCGFGSRKAELVDKIGDTKTIFFMVRYFIDNVPIDFMPDGFNRRINHSSMRTSNPETGAAIIGEGGDQLGRGARASAYFLDEAAFVERQDEVDTALSGTTDVQINISTFNGSANRFFLMNQQYRASEEGLQRLFICDYHDDPRKDDDWEAKKKAEPSFDEVAWAQEYDRDPYASQANSFIEAKWVKASIDAHIKLKFGPSGIRAASFDPADVGDAKGFVYRHGSVVLEAEQLTEGDITQAIPWADEKAQALGADVLAYEADGMGAPSMKLAMQNRAAGRMRIEPYYAGGAVEDPDGTYMASDQPGIPDKTNQDAFANYRAQIYTQLRQRFHNTYLAVQAAENGELIQFKPDELISLSSQCTHIDVLKAELSSFMRIWGANGKILAESKQKMKARGAKSPNLADALAGAMSRKPPMNKPKRKPRGRGHRRLKDRGMGY